MPREPLKSPSDLHTRLQGTLRGALVATFLGLSLLSFNATQLASIVVLPFSRRLFRAYNRWAADTFWSWCVKVSERINGTQAIITGDDVPPTENAIVLVNHQDMADITYLMFPAREKGRLGDMKYMLKDVIKYVPGVGWGLLFLDSLFVKRNWLRDQGSIHRTFERLLQARVPVWLINFAEGTRLTAEKLERSKRWAEEQGRRPLQHLLMPRTKGFVATVAGLRGHLNAVYDVTIGYEDGVPSLWQYLCGHSRKAHLHVRRFPIDSLPASSEELADWLFARFEEKDALLDAFYRDGAFRA